MRYSLESTPVASRPQIITDTDFLYVLSEAVPAFADHYHSAKKRGSIRTEKDGTDITLTFAFEQAWMKRSEEVRQETMTHAYLAFTALANFGEYHDRNSPLEMSLSTESLHDETCLGIHMALLKPKGRDKDIAAFTTKHMRRMARQLHYPDQDGSAVDSLVYATVGKESGISLHVNDTHSYVETDSSQYHAFSSWVELTSRNVESWEMQLICATGAIALAHFNELRDQ